MFMMTNSRNELKYIIYTAGPNGRAGRAKSRTVFYRSNTVIVGSKPSRDMDVCPRFSVFMLSCVGTGLASGWSPV
jgi:hypothetical protein